MIWSWFRFRSFQTKRTQCEPEIVCALPVRPAQSVEDDLHFVGEPRWWPFCLDVKRIRKHTRWKPVFFKIFSFFTITPTYWRSIDMICLSRESLTAEAWCFASPEWVCWWASHQWSRMREACSVSVCHRQSKRQLEMLTRTQLSSNFMKISWNTSKLIEILQLHVQNSEYSVHLLTKNCNFSPCSYCTLRNLGGESKGAGGTAQDQSLCTNLPP